MDTQEYKLRSKNEKIIHVAQCTLLLILEHGEEGVTFSRVSRFAGVSRSWLYKYLGNTTDQLIDFAVDYFGKLFSDLEGSKIKGTPKDWSNAIVNGIEKMLQNTSEYPWIIPIYFRYRGSSTVLGKRILKIERSYLKITTDELITIFKLDEKKAYLISQILTSFRMGLAHTFLTGNLDNPLNKKSVLNQIKKWLWFFVKQ